MEMSCGKVKYLTEILYLENTIKQAGGKNNSNNEETLDHTRIQKPYRCLALELLEISQTPDP
jgi:hypothetical protein